MESLILEWLNLLLRWLHVITGIAWIGASFYFVWLDNSLETPSAWKQDKGIVGDLWAFHGGGIYEVAKYQLAPEEMPANLHWFKWEAYATWISGALLLIVLYYLQADLYLVGQDAWITRPAMAIFASIGFLLAGVILYEVCVRGPLIQHSRLSSTFFFAAICGFSWLASVLFSDRAAFLHVGAMLATIMAANVLIGIIPAQKGFMRAIENGEQPNRASMLAAKQRSVHNNYFTLPVLFCMISNHYAFLYGHAYNWLILTVIIAVSAYARHFFNLRHRGIFKPQILLITAAILMSIVAFMALERHKTQQSLQTEDRSSAALSDASPLMALIEIHCSVCHAASPTQIGFSAAPAGLLLENPAQINAAKSKIIPAVESGYMPLGNITGMSAEEKQQMLKLLREM